MSNKKPISNFQASVRAVNNWYKEVRKLSNRLNFIDRHFYKGSASNKSLYDYLSDYWEKNGISFDSSDEKEGRIELVMLTVIFRYLFTFKRIYLWNPKDKRKPSLLSRNGEFNAKDYVKDKCNARELDDIEKLNLFDLIGKAPGGITIYRMFLVAYGIGKIFIQKAEWKQIQYSHSNDEPESKEARKLFNGEYDTLLLKCADAYHDQKKSERNQNKTESNSSKSTSKEVVSDFTVDDYLAGNLQLSEVEDTELLKQFHSDDRVKGAKKAAVTRRINALTEA